MFDQQIKEYFGIIAVILTFIGVAPYIRVILLNKIRPHAFTWVIWGVSTLIVFSAQVFSNAAAGSWAVGLSGVIAIFIAILAHYKSTEDYISKIDWVFLFITLLAIPCWYFTSNPLWAVVIIAIIDVIAYFPTLRKSYYKPYEEQVMIFAIMTVRNVFIIAAFGTYSLTNILLPALTGGVNLVVITLILFRRIKLKNDL